MKIALLQLNFTVGDLEGNAGKIRNASLDAEKRKAELVVTPELALTGYLPRDLLLDRGFIKQSWQTLESLAGELPDSLQALIGIPVINPSEGRPLFNAAVLIENGKIKATCYKSLLPTYDVFDEDRYFEPVIDKKVLLSGSGKIGITICEDIWNDRDFWKKRRYHIDPVADLAQRDVAFVINLSASPFTVGKQKLREEMLSSMARKHKVPILYVNQVGGNDDLIFDGRSFAADAKGRIIAKGSPFKEDLIIVDLQKLQGEIASDDMSPESETWHALVLGTRDYVRKCGFTDVLLGLSGGIDSSLTAAIAVEAVGAKNVLGVLMPSPYSSKGSVEDARQLAKNLGIKTVLLPIREIMESFEKTLRDTFKGSSPDVTEENIQARIRGNLLMALSNKFGSLLLSTGNKSELAVGYCTLYGDMSGGLAVISDLPKTMVYRLAKWFNKTGGFAIIPEPVLTKAPSAELKPDQTDQDSLPPYDMLDQILNLHIEQRENALEIIQKGFDEKTVFRVLEMVKKAEFKRKQAAPGLKVTDRAFGTGWRMPIAAARF